MIPFLHKTRQMGVAVDARPPREGEVLRTRVPDTMEGIRFEMSRMVETVREAVGDPVVVDAARMVLLASTEKNRLSEMAALYGWSKAHFHYVSDPIGKEYMQTTKRMVRQTQVPRAILARILQPIYSRASHGVVKMSGKDMHGPLPMALGDCEEASTFLAGLLGAIGILPRFRFGGAKNSLYHVWVQGFAPPDASMGVGSDGQWIDMDITEKSYDLGQHAPFQKYAHMDIFEA
jgi:hypothetical protein